MRSILLTLLVLVVVPAFGRNVIVTENAVRLDNVVWSEEVEEETVSAGVTGDPLFAWDGDCSSAPTFPDLSGYTNDFVNNDAADYPLEITNGVAFFQYSGALGGGKYLHSETNFVATSGWHTNYTVMFCVRTMDGSQYKHLYEFSNLAESGQSSPTCRQEPDDDISVYTSGKKLVVTDGWLPYGTIKVMAVNLLDVEVNPHDLITIWANGAVIGTYVHAGGARADHGEWPSDKIAIGVRNPYYATPGRGWYGEMFWFAIYPGHPTNLIVEAAAAGVDWDADW